MEKGPASLRGGAHAVGHGAERPVGVSVVICCHNSTERLSPTLAHLAAQQVPDGVDWEVLLIDNMSTDGTADMARSLWPAEEL